MASTTSFHQKCREIASRLVRRASVTAVRNSTALAAERVLVLAIDRWHPAAKIAEAANRPDLLEAAITINGAASTTNHVLHYGPIGVTEEIPGERRLHSLEKRELAPWPMLQPLLQQPASEQEQAIRYLVGRTRNVSQPQIDVNADLDALGDRWEGFEHMMRQFQWRMHMADSERVREVEPKVQSLLAVVGTEIYRALRADFLNRLATIVVNDTELISRVMRDGDMRSHPRKYSVQIDGKKETLEIRSPSVIAMLDSLYSPRPGISSMQSRGIKIAIGAKTILTIGITATPEFAIKNALRDTLAAFVLGRVWQAPWHMLKSSVEELRTSELSREWLLHGGSFCAFYEHSTDVSE